MNEKEKQEFEDMKLKYELIKQDNEYVREQLEGYRRLLDDYEKGSKHNRELIEGKNELISQQQEVNSILVKIVQNSSNLTKKIIVQREDEEGYIDEDEYENIALKKIYHDSFYGIHIEYIDLKSGRVDEILLTNKIEMFFEGDTLTICEDYE